MLLLGVAAIAVFIVFASATITVIWQLILLMLWYLHLCLSFQAFDSRFNDELVVLKYSHNLLIALSLIKWFATALAHISPFISLNFWCVQNEKIFHQWWPLYGFTAATMLLCFKDLSSLWIPKNLANDLVQCCHACTCARMHA